MISKIINRVKAQLEQVCMLPFNWKDNKTSSRKACSSKNMNTYYICSQTITYRWLVNLHYFVNHVLFNPCILPLCQGEHQYPYPINITMIVGICQLTNYSTLISMKSRKIHISVEYILFEEYFQSVDYTSWKKLTLLIWQLDLKTTNKFI